MFKNRIQDGFIYVTDYSFRFRKLIKSLAERAEKSLPSKKLKKIGIFLFGSPSRQEMVEESDADIIIIREKNSEDYETFRKEFIKLLERQEFDKIDVPNWGTFKDCKEYIKHSITEGNQVMESKFIYGDFDINKKIEKLKERYGTKKRFERVLCFQKLYFDQYYTQRTKTGVKNVKYGHGGTRDFMFPTWFINLLNISEGRKINIEDSFPLIYKSLSSLYERRFINLEDYIKYSESVNVVLLLRNEILIQNKYTKNAGLTYLDKNTINLLYNKRIFNLKKIRNKNDLKKFLKDHIASVAELKQKVWNLFLLYLEKGKGKRWVAKFKDFLSGKIERKDVENIDNSDYLMQMAAIWDIDSRKNKDLFNYVFDKYSKSNKWEILASLCCHHQCSDKILRKVSEKGCEKGFEYLLRIISRNKNVTKKTLKKIIDSPNLEKRYKVVAKTAYEKGVKKANELR